MDYNIKNKYWEKLKTNCIPNKILNYELVWYKGNKNIKFYIMKHYDKLHYFKKSEIEDQLYNDINAAESFSSLNIYSQELIYNAFYDKDNHLLRNEQYENIEHDIVYSLDSIIGIKNNFLFFDENGKECTISLKECGRNYALEFNSDTGEYTDFDGNPVKDIDVEKCTCVGTRDICAENPCFTLNTTPKKTRFEMMPSKQSLIKRLFKIPRNTDKFHKFYFLLQENGWTTFDLT